MSMRKTFLGTLAAAGLAGALLTAVTPTAAQAAEGCNTSNARTVANASTHSRGIELRYNGACAWGRIFGSPGDLVWVDRSFDGGRTWEQLSVTKINTGGSNFTDAFNNRGNLMRACGKAGNFPEVACTTWW
ncbi:glycosyl hydrolase [Streptomyces malaysiensis]|uniref:Glycosyl hydrolase n=1 Tax=Streptomyces malaysiensis subsp. samsunensis TaxID=459658 RepID=A0A9X2LRY1_STRMQ|nr:glycosyl hydrolase [Streptomyces samsunensis]MCQ8828708.1 glycosyl hydrolase [Streptomyces samsunensis]